MYIYWFSLNLRAVTAADANDDDDNAGRHCTTSRATYRQLNSLETRNVGIYIESSTWIPHAASTRHKHWPVYLRSSACRGTRAMCTMFGVNSSSILVNCHPSTV